MRQKDKHIRIDSTQVQGPESYVVVKSPSWGLLRKAQRMQADGADPGMVGVEFAEAMIQESVLDWNWADDQDAPLPTPVNDPEVVGLLTVEEVTFLVAQINGLVSKSSGN